ncbi:ubiquinone biosynthesis accessory factor UbiJ [Neisseria musculi]|uniref:ubiquinone biosynthesis accessory factor UbiJ n=1 Tax=Neisseria musculi TaxID=1815583 RepID=UPI00164B68A8|nr:SCP2 domain-containing protein [Neisseria musculi]
MSALLPVINHLIRQNRETQALLGGFAGQTLSLHAAGMQIRGTFNAEGFLEYTPDAADTEIRFLPGAVEKVLQGQTPGVGDVSISGDTGLGTALLPLIGGLRYHANDDLSRLLGDAAAGSIAVRTEKAARTVKQIGLSILEQLSDFAKEPEAPVADRHALSAWAREIDALRDDTARFEARLAKLEAQSKG